MFLPRAGHSRADTNSKNAYGGREYKNISLITQNGVETILKVIYKFNSS